MKVLVGEGVLFICVNGTLPRSAPPLHPSTLLPHIRHSSILVFGCGVCHPAFIPLWRGAALIEKQTSKRKRGVVVIPPTTAFSMVPLLSINSPPKMKKIVILTFL